MWICGGIQGLAFIEIRVLVQVQGKGRLPLRTQDLRLLEREDRGKGKERSRLKR